MLSRLFALLRTDSGILGAVTTNDLLWQMLAEVRWSAIQRSIETTSDLVVVPTVVSLFSGLDTQLQLVALAAQWVFVATIFYSLTPRVFRDATREVTATRSFRIVTTFVALGFALSLSSLTLGNPVVLEERGVFWGVALVAIVSGLGAYGWYFRVIQDWRRRSLEARIDLLARFVPLSEEDREELLAARDADERWAGVRTWSVFPAIVMVCLIIAFVFGTFSMLVLALNPLVEVLALVSVALVAANRRYPLQVADWGVDRDVLDLEGRLYDVVSYLGRGVKSWSTVFLIVFFGLSVQVIAFTLAFQLVLDETAPFFLTVLQLGVTDVPTATLAWNTIGIGVCLLVASVYGVWYWLRMLERVPAFLDAWEVGVGRRETVADRTETARPVGLMLPPSLSFFCVTLWLAFNPAGSGTNALTMPAIGFAVGWPATIVSMLASVWRTSVIDPQPPQSDELALPLSLVVQFGLGFAFLWLTNIGPGQTEPTTLTVSLFGVFVLLAGPWIFFLEDVYVLGENRRGIGSYVFPAYLAGFALVVLLFPTPNPPWLLAFSGVVIVGSLVLAVDQYVSK